MYSLLISDELTQLIKIEKLFSPKEKKLMEMKKKFALGFCIDIVIVIEKQSPPGIYLGQSIVRFASNIGVKTSSRAKFLLNPEKVHHIH